MADPQKLSTTMFRWVNSGGPVPVMVQARLNTGEVIGPMDELKKCRFQKIFPYIFHCDSWFARLSLLHIRLHLNISEFMCLKMEFFSNGYLGKMNGKMMRIPWIWGSSIGLSSFSHHFPIIFKHTHLHAPDPAKRLAGRPEVLGVAACCRSRSRVASKRLGIEIQHKKATSYMWYILIYNMYTVYIYI